MGDLINDTQRIFIDFGLSGIPAAERDNVRQALEREVRRIPYGSVIRFASLCNKCNSVSQQIRDLLDPQRTVQESDRDELQELREKLVTNLERLEDECKQYPGAFPHFEAFPQFVVCLQRRLIIAQREIMVAKGIPGVKALGPYPREYVDPLVMAYLASLVSETNVPDMPADGGELPAKWHAMQEMEGGMGEIKIFCEFDANETLVDRVVQKDTQSRNEDRFHHYRLWHGPVADRVPIEYWTQYLAAPNAKKEILGLRANYPIVDIPRRMYRMYLAYAARGDLFNLMQRHYGDGDATFEPVSRSFVLYVFLALVKALLALEKGDGQRMIVHRDLKPDNVFLDNPNRAVFRSYPQPKLADFGLAFLTTDTDASNPALWFGCGTHGFMAPEMLEFIDSRSGQPFDDFKMLSPCNVWGIGAILYSLMTLSQPGSAEQPSYLPGEEDRYSLAIDDYSGWYGRGLCDLVNNCMLPQPDERPTPKNLRKAIDRLIYKERASTDALIGDARPEDMVKMQSEIYRLGMSRGEAMQAVAS